MYRSGFLRQRGASLPELLGTVAIGAVMLTLGALAVVPWYAHESMRGALYDAGAMLQVTRMEAVTRNHACSFHVDLGSRNLTIVDSNGTPSTADDVVLETLTLPATVSVARPDPGLPVTFEDLGGSVYRVQFDRDGHVISGTGEMVLFGGERYAKIQVYAAGGVRKDRWNGTAWVPGA